MVVSRSTLWGVCGSLVMIVGLQACATTPWTNAAKSQTEVTADQAACYAQLAQETHGGAVSLYVGSCPCVLRVIPAVQNPVQCPFYHLCEGAVPWYPISFSTSSGSSPWCACS